MTRVVLGLIALVSFLVAAGIRFGVLGAWPHVQDEAAYLFQARVLAAGELWAAPHPLGQTVPFTVVDGEGRWFGAFPDGWPALLAAAVWLGEGSGLAPKLPYLLNPLLVGLAVWRAGVLAGRLARRDTGADAGVARRAAWASAALLGFSPQVLLLGASLMSHSWVLLCAVRAMELADHELRAGFGERRGVRGFLELGLWIGLCAWARPVCGASLALALFAWYPDRRWGWAMVTAALPVSLQLGHNVLLTGSPSVWPIDLYTRLLVPDRPGCSALGFGPDRGCAPGMAGHDLAGAVTNTVANLRAWLWLVPLPVLLPALFSAASRRILVFAAGFTALVMGVYALYWYAGTCYGARFYHVALAPLCVAAGVGVAGLPARGFRLTLLVLVAVQWASLTRGLPELVNYWGMDGRFVALAANWTAGPAVILVVNEGATMNLDLPLTGVVGQSVPPSTLYRALLSPDRDAEIYIAMATPRALTAAAALGRPVFRYRMYADPAQDSLEAWSGAGPR